MDDPQPILYGASVLLRPFEATDADAVFQACQDEAISRWTTVPRPYRLSDAVTYVEQLAPAAWGAGGAVFAVVEAVGGQLMGSMGVHRMDNGIAHVGYWTAPAGRRQGRTREALGVLSRWLLQAHGAVRVELVVEPGNEGSLRVAEGAGFVREGVLRRRLVLRGEHVDVVMFSLLASDLAVAGNRQPS